MLDCSKTVAQSQFKDECFVGCIGRAANDLTLLFRKTAHELSSAFTVWALRLTERCVSILVVDVLLPYALPMGLSAVMECVLQVMVYCSCLEDTHRVCLQPHLLRVLWPQIENAIDSHVIRYFCPLPLILLSAGISLTTSLGSASKGFSFARQGTADSNLQSVLPVM